MSDKGSKAANRGSIVALGLSLVSVRASVAAAVVWPIVLRDGAFSVSQRVVQLPRAVNATISSLLLFGMAALACGAAAFACAMWRASWRSAGVAALATALAVAGLVICFPFGWSVSGSFELMRRDADAACAANLKQLGHAVLDYARDHDDTLPDGRKWCDEVLPYVRTRSVFVCPYAPQARSGYAFNSLLSRRKLSSLADPAHTLMLFESDAGWNAAGGLALNATPGRHFGGMEMAGVTADSKVVGIFIEENGYHYGRPLPKVWFEPGKLPELEPFRPYDPK